MMGSVSTFRGLARWGLDLSFFAGSALGILPARPQANRSLSVWLSNQVKAGTSTDHYQNRTSLIRIPSQFV
jgi:hypothetical protein